MGLFDYLKSTLLSKVVMAVTGIILVLFIIGHTIGNMQVFLGREVFNTYAAFLQSLGELLWVVRGVLFLSLVFHIITSVKLKLQNLGSKPDKYEVKNYVKAKLTSRTMIWTGIMIFAFLTYHILHFTAGVTNPDHYNVHEYYEKEAYSLAIDSNTEFAEGESEQLVKQDLLFKRHDVYKMVILGFREPVISIVYIIGVILLGFHLSHAIQSAFQTLGVSGPRFTPCMIKTSNALSIIIVLCLISIPIAILAGLAGGCV